MKDLIELVTLVQKTKFKSNGLLDLIVEPDTQIGQLFNAISHKTVQSDEDAKMEFPEFAKDPGRLANVKSKLKDRLCDSVFLLGFKESSYADRQRAFIECTKKWASSMILVNKNARLIAINQLELLLKHTMYFEFTELTIDILRVLRLHHGLCGGDEKKFMHYETQLHEFEQLWLAESRIESLYMNLVVQYVNTKSGKSAIAEKTEILEMAQAMMREHASFKIHLFARLIEVTIYDSRNDFAQTEKACESALQFFGEKPYQSGLSLEIFYYNLIICYLYSRKYAEGLKMIELFAPQLVKGSFNWYKLKELHLYTCLHAQHYQKAFEIFAEVTAQPDFANLPPAVREIWKVVEAYFYYLSGIGVVQGEDAEKLYNYFKIGRFLNEVPTLSKDKRGMNVSIIIVQFLRAALDLKIELADERVDALNKYRTRYLNNHETSRSNYFLGMLVQVLQCGHDLRSLVQKSQKFMEKLNAVPWETVNQNHEIEIVPYEHLWALILNDLIRKRQAKIAGPVIAVHNGPVSKQQRAVI